MKKNSLFISSKPISPSNQPQVLEYQSEPRGAIQKQTEAQAIAASPIQLEPSIRQRNNPSSISMTSFPAAPTQETIFDAKMGQNYQPLPPQPVVLSPQHEYKPTFNDLKIKSELVHNVGQDSQTVGRASSTKSPPPPVPPKPKFDIKNSTPYLKSVNLQKIKERKKRDRSRSQPRTANNEKPPTEVITQTRPPQIKSPKIASPIQNKKIEIEPDTSKQHQQKLEMQKRIQEMEAERQRQEAQLKAREQQKIEEARIKAEKQAEEEARMAIEREKNRQIELELQMKKELEEIKERQRRQELEAEERKRSLQARLVEVEQEKKSEKKVLSPVSEKKKGGMFSGFTGWIFQMMAIDN